MRLLLFIFPKGRNTVKSPEKCHYLWWNFH